MLRSRLLAALAALALLLTLPACDGDDGGGGGTQVSFGDFIFSAVGGATVTEQGGRLVVSNIGTSGQDGIQTPLSGAQTDVTLEPVTLSQGAEFVQRYLNAGGTEVAQVIHDGIGSSEERVTIDFAGASRVRVVYYNDGEVVWVSSPTLSGNLTASLPSTRVGTSSSGTGSVHVVRVGGRTVVGTDYGGSLSGIGSSVAPARRGTDFFIPEAEQTFTVDFIEFIPLAANGTAIDLPIESLRLTAASIDQFVLTEADEQASTTFTYDAFDPSIRGLFYSEDLDEYLQIDADLLISYVYDADFMCYNIDTLSFVERTGTDQYTAGSGSDQGTFTFTPEGDGLDATNPDGDMAFFFRSEEPSGGFNDCGSNQ